MDRGTATTSDLFRAYVRSLRWQVPLSPLLFLRYELSRRQDKRPAIWLALSIGWMAVSRRLMFVLLASVVAD